MEEVFDKRRRATVRDLLVVAVEFASGIWTGPRVPDLMACIVAFVAFEASVYDLELLKRSGRVTVDILLHDIVIMVRTQCERNQDENARRVENID